MNFLLKNNTLNNINTWLAVLMMSFPFLPVAADAENINKLIESPGQDINIEKVVDGLKTPWAMAFISTNKMLVTEREGQVLLLDLTIVSKKVIKNTPKIMVNGQGGMLDMALSPSYKKTGWIYFTYVKEIKGQGATVLARAKLKQDTFYNWQELLVTRSRTDTSQHFGSRIAFDNQGHVYFSVGDRGVRANGQDLTTHAGSILRLSLDGTIPEDNPFVASKTVLPEIWSYGHRNPQGLTYDFIHNRLWEIEHGPRGGDEINLIIKGANYGWPVISYGKEYWGPVAVGEGTHRKGMQQPVKYYVPSIAPGSLLIYSGNMFAKWKGNLFSGALKLRHLNRIVLNESGDAIKEERLLGFLNERIRALSQSPKGEVYFSTDSGKIYRITSRR